jgi:tRNA nucleotidyltransferase (CCA-adding enzyme)
MDEIFRELANCGGTCYFTGTSAMEYILTGILPKYFDIVCFGAKRADFQEIIKKFNLKLDENKYYHLNLGEEGFRISWFFSPRDFFTPIDFSIYSIFINCLTNEIYDPQDGLNDLYNKVLRIHKPLLLEQPVKMLEACLLAGKLGFTLHLTTWTDIFENSPACRHINGIDLGNIIGEALTLEKPSLVFKILHETRILSYIFPELADCSLIMQNKRSGVHNVFEHTMYAIDACENKLDLRLAVLFHDIAKPMTIELTTDGKIHFFKHEIEGAKIAKRYLKYWGIEKSLITKISHLVLHHMFDADPRLTEKSVRRLIRKVGKNYVYDLIKIREADRRGTPEVISMKKINLLKKKIAKEIDKL